MYKNYGTIDALMDGAELLYTMVSELTEGVAHLPGCRMTSNLKRVAANIDLASSGVYRTMQNIAADGEPTCDEYDTEEYDDDDIPTGDDLQELLDKIAYILASGKPVSISADIYINEDNDAAEDKE